MHEVFRAQVVHYLMRKARFTLAVGLGVQHREAAVYSGAAVAKIAAGNLAYTAHQYGLSWCASNSPRALQENNAPVV